jgi:hypothetical protein
MEKEAEAAKEIESFQWRVRLSDSNPGKRYVLLAAVLLAFIFGTVVYGKLLLGLLGSAMILAATAEFWLGTSYKLDASGATSRTGFSLSKLAWSEVKRAVVTPVGIKLSPLDETSKLSPFRGIFLRFGREDRVRVENVVRMLGGENVRFVEGTAD